MISITLRAIPWFWVDGRHPSRLLGYGCHYDEHICGGEMGRIEQVQLSALCTVETGRTRGTTVRNRLMWEAIVTSGRLPPVAIGGHFSVCGLGWHLRLCWCLVVCCHQGAISGSLVLAQVCGPCYHKSPGRCPWSRLLTETMLTFMLRWPTPCQLQIWPHPSLLMTGTTVRQGSGE